MNPVIPTPTTATASAPATTVMIGGELTVGRIGYGAMQLTGPKVWGEYPDHHGAVALLRAVVESGVTFIDTADVYGPHSNEELIREALHPYPPNLVIATKGGFVRGGPEYSDMSAVGNRNYLKQSVYMSMRRLGLDHIDLYYLHTPTATDVPFEDQVATLAEMRARGLIRHVGLSNVSAEQFRTALSITEIAAVTAHYNVGVRLGAALFKVADEAGVVFSPWHPAAVRGETKRPGFSPCFARLPAAAARPSNRSRSLGSCTAHPARSRSPAPRASITYEQTSPLSTSDSRPTKSTRSQA
jgi:aryl-alcohol dehydrogenase-like predicted oxidoreductase